MLYITALFLIALAAVPAIIAAVRRDHKMLLGTGTVLIVLASGLLISGLQIPNGKTITKTEIDANTTEITETTDYADIEKNSFENASTYTGIAILGIVIYTVFVGSLVPYKKRG